MQALAAEATKQGTVAGDLLGLMYEMHLQGMDEPSFGKAIENYKQFALPLRYGDGEALKRSEATLRQYFNAFESVAHLWAAFRLNQGPYAYTADPKDIFHTPEGLRALLPLFGSPRTPRPSAPQRGCKAWLALLDMLQHGPITHIHWLTMGRGWRLAAAIKKLRYLGWPIESWWVSTFAALVPRLPEALPASRYRWRWYRCAPG
jgi:hypothetical protein